MKPRVSSPAALFLAALVAIAMPLAVPPSLQADTAPLIPREVLFGNPDRANPMISPDGTKLAYLRADAKNVLQVWVRTIGKTDDRQVTNDPKRGVRQYFWHYDNAQILYMQDKDGDENFHLNAVGINGGDTKDLTPIEGARVVPVAYEPETPDEGIIQHNGRNKRSMDVYRLNTKTGAITLIEENPGDVGAYLFDKQMAIAGKVLLKPEGGSTLRLKDAKTGEWREALSWGSDDQFNPIGFTADGATLYATSNLTTDTAELIAMDRATGKVTSLAGDKGADANMTLMHPVSNTVQAVSFNRLRNTWKTIDPTVAKDFTALAKLEGGDFGVVSQDLADRNWIVAYTKDDGPVKWYAWDRAGQKGTFLFNNQPALEKYTLTTIKGVEIPARDGLSLPSYLATPAGMPAKNLPLVMYVHGGPWARDNWGYNSTAQWLANRGYAVLMVNYRGSSGFGKGFRNAAKKEFAGKMHDDLIDAVNWAIKEGVADPKKVGIMGGSYGGYATLVGLTFTPDVFACGVDIVGPSSLASLIESFPPYWGPYLANTWYPFVGDPKNAEQRKDMEARSPLYKIDAIKAPLLIGQGANDPRVTQKESDKMVEAMRKAGKEVEYVVFADEGHGFARPENRLKFNATAESFLGKHLGGRVELPSAADSEAN